MNYWDSATAIEGQARYHSGLLTVVANSLAPDVLPSGFPKGIVVRGQGNDTAQTYIHQDEVNVLRAELAKALAERDVLKQVLGDRLGEAS
jgi:hypothetical protein